MPAKRLKIQPPIGGVSEDVGFSDQPAGTSQDAQNMRGVDPDTGRVRLSVRTGTRRYCDKLINGTTKIDHVASINYAKSNQTIADGGVSSGSLEVEWEKGNTVTGNTTGVQAGTQGDAYSLDGNTGISKRNRDGALMWKITLAATDKNHVVRALLVDSSTPGNLGSDFVFAGVSTGGDSTKAKAWAYRQLNDNKVEKVWELDVGGYVEGFTITKDKLYLLTNFPDQNRSYIIVYDDYLTNSPTEVNRWPVPTNGTSIDSGTQDGFIFTTHDVSSDRDTFPGHPLVSWASEDWTIKDLPNGKDRIWCNLDASIEETLSITPRNLSFPGQDQTHAGEQTAPPSDLLDGGNVLAWIDSSGNGRNLYQTAETIPQCSSGGTYSQGTRAAARGAIYKKTGAPNGKGCLYFDGVTTGMVSEAPTSKDKASKSSSLSLLPSYKGAQFACFMVIRANADAVRRGLLSWGGDTSAQSRALLVNSSSGAAYASTVGTAEVEGELSLYESGGVAADAAFQTDDPTVPTGPNGYPLGGSLPDSGLAVITWICDGGVHDHATTATRSQFRVNGHPCDRWQSAAFSTLFATKLGYHKQPTAACAGFIGDVMQILVLSDWTDKNGVQQQLLANANGVRYPDSSWSASGDSELERIEGWLAHRWGTSHELDGGNVSYITLNSQPQSGVTKVSVTVDAVTTDYLFKTTPAAANEVAIGSTLRATAANLARAINANGEPDVDYYRTTVAHPSVRARFPFTRYAKFFITAATVTNSGGGDIVQITTPTNALADFVPANTVLTAGSFIVEAGSSVNTGTYGIASQTNGTTFVTGTGLTAAGGTISSAYITVTLGYKVAIRNRNPNKTSSFTIAVTTGTCDVTVQDGTSSMSGLIDAVGQNHGWYPHPFFLERTARTYGGPPRVVGLASQSVSKYWLLRSPYTILAAWDPANGSAKDVLTTNYDDTAPTTASAGTGIGGIGSCVRCASSGAVFTCGPRQASVSSGSAWGANGANADAQNARRIKWANQAFTLTGTGTWIWGSANGSYSTFLGGGTAFSPGEFTYSYPRMAVDKYDNLFMPYSGTGATSLWIFDSDGSGGNAIVLSNNTLDDSQEGYAVAVDPTYPDFTDFSTLERAEFCILGTSYGATNRYSLHRLRTLETTTTAATPRDTALIAVSGGNIYEVPSGNVDATEIATGLLAADTSLVMSTPFQGLLYLTDGLKTAVYDPRAGTAAAHVATSSGGAPSGYSIIATWNNSLVFARHKDNPSQYLISEQGDPGGFDTDPYTISQSQAIKGSDGSAGLPSDIINAFIPWNDDLAFLGGDHSIFRLTGRPSPGSGGEIHLVSDSVGIAFGKAWCKDPRGYIYFFASRGGVYGMAPGGLPQPLRQAAGKEGSRSSIERRLQDIDLGVYRVEMAWNDKDKGFHLAVVPIGESPGDIVESYFWEQPTGAWWPDTFQDESIQPTCLGILDGDDPDDRKVLFGASDSRVRVYDGSITADNMKSDGTVDNRTKPINASVLIGPLVPKETDFEVCFSALEVVLADDQDGAPICSVYVTDRADNLGQAVWSGSLTKGRNPFINFRRRGAFFFLELTSSDSYGRWSVEQMSILVEQMGIKRVSAR